MRILVIGGSGNISTAITAELLHMGHQVTLLNRGTRPIPGTSQITGDRYQKEEFLSLVQGHYFDCVIDMICYHPKDAQTLVDAFAGKIEQLIFCSTVNTYQAPATSYPVTEEEPICTNPQFTYAYHKELCERLLTAAAEENAFSLTIIRPGATVGDDTLPIPLIGDSRGLMYRMMAAKPIILMGDGSSLWCTAHRDDIGKAIAHAVLNPKAYGQAYTIASEHSITWEQYYQIAAQEFGAPAPTFIRIPWEQLVALTGDENSWIGLNFRFNNIYSCQKARRDLDFQETISWREIMKRSAQIHGQQEAFCQQHESPEYDRIVKAYLNSTHTDF